MSRIGKLPVPIPQGVKVSLKGNRILVKGPKGELDWTLPEGIRASIGDGKVKVDRRSNAREQKALHGLARNLIYNMVKGVFDGYQRRLTIVGVGYSAKIEEGKLILNVGFCHPLELPIPPGIEVENPRRTNTLILSGVDKQKIGQFAADIRGVRPPEPYKGKGIRYEDEFIHRKAGKSVVGTAK